MSWHLLLMLVAIVTTLPLVFWLHWRWRNRRLLELAASVPGPPALPVLGNALLFMASPNEQLKLIGELMKDYGEYVRFWLGPDLNIGVENPEDIKLLLSSNKVNQKGPVYEHLKSVIGSGILTGGKVWRNHRKIITPSYNKKSVAHFAKVFNMESAGLVQALSKKDPSKTFDIYWDIVNCTTQCVCREKKKVEYYSNVVHNLCAEIFEKRRKALARGEGVEDHARGIVDRLILSGELTELEIRQETFTLFTTYWDEPNKVKPERFLPENVKKRNPNAFVPFSLGPMDCLGRVYATVMIKTIVVRALTHLRFEADGRLEDLEVQVAISVKSIMLCLPTPLQLVITMTLTLLVYWLHWRWRNRRLLELAARVPGPPALPVLGNALLFMASPNDQLKLLEEVLNRYGQYVKFWMGPDLNIIVKNAEDIKDKVFNEIQECLGPDGDFVTADQLKRRITLPVGTSLVFPIHILHRDPQYWEEPNKVKPDRFLPENVKQRKPNSFIPFSSGPMDCLGTYLSYW
ncbi:hypothetical protein MSG28_005664 [Choristoneura fumiferana]|uniref:Uncharacterized protein n=2 Tax=Choristoneura fumiferana TaxID=7141 RepID=A0ACC0KZT7_CHOFU|nr:hypothetical protein MSG28_005664 [Choristoneura fumiferana]